MEYAWIKKPPTDVGDFSQLFNAERYKSEILRPPRIMAGSG